MAIVPYMDRISAQNRSDPACPLQNEVNTYTLGMAALMCPATYSSEKSRVINAVQRPTEARTIIANVA